MKISKTTNSAAPIVLIYGSEGRGKTSLGCKFPQPVALLLEKGLPRGVSVDAVEDVKNFDDVMSTLRELYKDPQGYQTLVLDTVDALEPLLLEAVCTKHNWKNIEQPSYGKGWLFADEFWRQFIAGINALREKHNMTVVMIAHSMIERIDDPRAPTYTTFLPKLHKRARHLLLDASDAVLFLAEDLRVATDDGGFRERTRATSSNARHLFCEGTAAFSAKNRYQMPQRIAVPPDFQIGELTKFWS